MDEPYQNGDKLAATREDLAGFRGAVTSDLRGIKDSIGELTDLQRQQIAQTAELAMRVTRLEDRNQYRGEARSEVRAQTDDVRAQRAERRAMIAAVVTVAVFLLGLARTVFRLP